MWRNVIKMLPTTILHIVSVLICIEILFSFICSIDVQDYECLGVANVYKNLVMMFPSVCMNALSKEFSTKFIENLKRLTCAFGVEAAMEEEVGSTLKMPGKPASENIPCLCRLLKILANFSNLVLHTSKQCGP